MPDRGRPAYMPPNLAGEIRSWAPPELSADELYRLQRIAERIHADGYDSGHVAGYQDAVSRLREALAAKAEETKDA
jgi:hypothetical protein